MKTVYLSCVVLIVVCFGCSNNGTGPGPPPPPDEKETAILFIISSQYGKPIPGSSGQVTYCRESSGSFKATVTMNGLEESHPYALVLNGKVGSQGNDCLPEKYNNNEGYVNRLIQTDKDGSYQGELSIRLKPCEYVVKFLVTDQSDWKVVLHNDFLTFTITE